MHPSVGSGPNTTPCESELRCSRSLTSGFHFGVDAFREICCSVCCGLDTVGWFVPLSTSFCQRRWLLFNRVWAVNTTSNSNLSRLQREMSQVAVLERCRKYCWRSSVLILIWHSASSSNNYVLTVDLSLAGSAVQSVWFAARHSNTWVC